MTLASALHASGTHAGGERKDDARPNRVLYGTPAAVVRARGPGVWDELAAPVNSSAHLVTQTQGASALNRSL